MSNLYSADKKYLLIQPQNSGLLRLNSKFLISSFTYIFSFHISWNRNWPWGRRLLIKNRKFKGICWDNNWQLGKRWKYIILNKLGKGNGLCRLADVHEVLQWLEEPWDNKFKGQEHENSDKWLLHGGGIYVAWCGNLHICPWLLIHDLGCSIRPQLFIFPFSLTAFVFAFKQVILLPSETEANREGC